MNYGRVKRAGFVAALFAACLMVSAVAEASSYKTKYFNIYYYNSWQKKAANGIKSYADEGFQAAYKTIGSYYYYPSQGKKFSIEFYSDKDGKHGYMNGGKQVVNLNVYYLKSKEYAAWGNVIAHETAHVLFYNQTYANRWNSGLKYYRTFLTEALSWYAGDCVYGWANGTSSGTYSKSYIRSQVKYYSSKANFIMSWYGAGYYYKNKPGGYKGSLTTWNLRAIGSFLTNDYRYGSYYRVKSLLTYLRDYSTTPGSKLRSSDFSTARYYFENAFKRAYGQCANSGWQYTGSSGGAYKSTSYLYGKFYGDFYL